MFFALLAVAAALDIDAAFQKFLTDFNRNYTADERVKRRAIFAKNMKFVETENAKGTNTYKLGITPFADKTVEEFSSRMKAHPKPANPSFRSVYEFKGVPIPESVDWVAKGAVNVPEDQGDCGSCWSFSASGALEGARTIYGEGLVKLSVQDLLDCDKEDFKCEGGWMESAFEYVSKNGQCTESSDPYECNESWKYDCKNSKCPASCEVAIKPGEVSRVLEVPANKSDIMREALSYQPVSVGIDASGDVIMLYSEGIIPSTSCGIEIDHGVLAVGYGSEKGIGYFKVKNSWGPKWGEEGFFRVADDDACGVLLAGSFPKYSPLPETIIV